jgi:hypothetical protein
MKAGLPISNGNTQLSSKLGSNLTNKFFSFALISVEVDDERSSALFESLVDVLANLLGFGISILANEGSNCGNIGVFSQLQGGRGLSSLNQLRLIGNKGETFNIKKYKKDLGQTKMHRI